MTDSICSFPGCTRRTQAKTLCLACYKRWRRACPLSHVEIPFSLRFWGNVEPQPNGCWHWTGELSIEGYGRVALPNRRRVHAHRAAWTLTHGEIPTGMVACHKCDNRRCVNPAHIFIGTQRDNIHDMISKGRHANLRGEQRATAKLTDAAVRAARQRYANGERVVALAAEYGVSQGVMAKALSRQTWRHVQ